MRTRPPPSSLRINLFELRNFPLNIDTELQVLKLLDSPTFQLPITECLTASELLPINPPHTMESSPLPRLLLYFPARKDYLPGRRPVCSNCSPPPILVILVGRLID